jgi:small-conductance mechanosensitive channel
MKTIRIVRLTVFSGLLALLIAFKEQYNYLTSQVDLPERFEHTVYRVFMAYFVLEIARMIILLTYKPQNPKRRKDNFTIGVSHVSRIVYALLAILVLLSLFNLSVREAITSLSLLAAAIVLITKEYIANLINGMYLTFNKVVNIGDQVRIGLHRGKILDITLTNVHLLNDDDDIIYIPNNTVFSAEIINYTRRELKKSNIDFEVDPERVRDLEKLEKELISALTIFADEIQANSCNLKTVLVKREYIQLKFQYILTEPLNKEVDKRIRKYFLQQLIRIIYDGTAPGEVFEKK